MKEFRVGQGYDVHQLKEGYDLWLGGIKVDHHLGAVGHSDADVLLHVICDAMLGAAGMRDIGFHFPDTDPAYKGIDSKKLLESVVSLLKDSGYSVGNIDSTVCLQSPKIGNRIPQMVKCISEILGIEDDCVSIKATTTEKLGFVGREEGVSAHCVVLIYRH